MSIYSYRCPFTAWREIALNVFLVSVIWLGGQEVCVSSLSFVNPSMRYLCERVYGYEFNCENMQDVVLILTEIRPCLHYDKKYSLAFGESLKISQSPFSHLIVK